MFKKGFSTGNIFVCWQLCKDDFWDEFLNDKLFCSIVYLMSLDNKGQICDIYKAGVAKTSFEMITMNKLWINLL